MVVDGALVFAAVVALVTDASAAGADVEIAGAGGAFVTSCATTLPAMTAAKIIPIFLFINCLQGLAAKLTPVEI